MQIYDLQMYYLFIHLEFLYHIFIENIYTGLKVTQNGKEYCVPHVYYFERSI